MVDSDQLLGRRPLRPGLLADLLPHRRGQTAHHDGWVGAGAIGDGIIRVEAIGPESARTNTFRGWTIDRACSRRV